jgi:hypothetical protein
VIFYFFLPNIGLVFIVHTFLSVWVDGMFYFLFKTNNILLIFPLLVSLPSLVSNHVIAFYFILAQICSLMVRPGVLIQQAQ